MIIANKETILLVEDDRLYKKLFTHLLESWGYWVIVADTKEIAFDILTANDIASVILDYHIIGGTSIPILLALQEIEPDLPVYANSADPFSNAELIELGCRSAINKDIRMLAKIFKRG